MSETNVLLLCGGGGTEHEISLISAEHIRNSLKDQKGIRVIQIEICKDGSRVDFDGNKCELRKSGEVYYPSKDETVPLHFAIPCIHGPPGESGEIQGIFEQMGLPYLGAGSEASILCFNKVSTKLYLDSLEIPNTPYTYLWGMEQIDDAKTILDEWKPIFVKASNQGSSVGCYKVDNEKDLVESIEKAFKLSPYVLLEKGLVGRELEIAVYELNDKLIASYPGEIICPSGFYTYEEKYDQKSHTETAVKAKDLDDEVVEQMRSMAIEAFKALKIKDLSRIDFFLTKDGSLYLNEINTFPGMTPISMFPKMMEMNGDDFTEFLMEKIVKRKRTI